MTFHGDFLQCMSHANTPKPFETNRCLSWAPLIAFCFATARLEENKEVH